MKKIKLLTIIGARPQIIKAAAISRAIKKNFSDKLEEIILHTGQHYDANMSQVFFDELGIPRPDHTFSLTGKTPEEQMKEMEEGISKIIKENNPTAVLVYGDTNSTYSGAKAAADLDVPVLHVEAGLRSYNDQMPEERNRVYADSVSTMLFCPTKTGYDNLVKQGFPENNLPPYNSRNPKIYHCGDVMYDNSMYFSEIAEKKTDILTRHSLEKNKFILATIHRNTNTDDEGNLNRIFSALNNLSNRYNIKILLPLHPRTKKMTAQLLKKDLKKAIEDNKNFVICDPVSFLEMIMLEKNCSIVMTDSGGVQKEAFYFKKPCIVLRTETEWVELVECGAAIVAGTSDEAKIISAFEKLYNDPPKKFPPYYGDAHAAEFICNEIIKNFPVK